MRKRFQKLPAAFGAALRRLSDRGSLSPEMVAAALYRGILGREPDLGGHADKVLQLRHGDALEQVIRTFIASPEFHARMLEAVAPSVRLPDLTQAMPEMYRQEAGVNVYVAENDA